MIFRPYAVIAMLLLSMTLLAQTSAPKPPSPAPSSAASAAAPTPGGPYPVMSPAAEARGRQLFELWNNGQAGALFATFSEGLKKKAGGEAKFAAYMKKLQEQVGKETKMEKDFMSPGMLAPVTEYGRLSQYSKATVKVISTFVIDERGQVQAFMFGPQPNLPEGRYAGYQNSAKLRLPFNGEWFVLQGGHSLFDNGYMRAEEARFAADFTMLKNGRPYAGDPTSNESFYCFGQPVLAPADGTVVRVESGFVDNQPGSKPTQDSPRGNFVILNHGNQEFTVLDHLKQNSIPVKKGDAVKQGDVIGACGNSGSSPAPHVHFQMQNTAGLPTPDPLPAQFHDYIANGKPVAVGEPVKAQTVSNAPTTGGSSTDAATTPKNEPVKK